MRITIAVGALSGLVGSMIFTFFHNLYYERSFGVVRIDELIGSHVVEQNNQYLTQDQIKDESEHYAIKLKKIIKQYSEKGVILLVAPAVVTQIPDYTDIIKEELK